MVNCPNCSSKPLKPTLLDDRLPAYGCASCSGALLSLIAFRAWGETQGIGTVPVHQSELSITTDDTRKAITCPKCSAIMTKYDVSATVSNHLDYCASCEEVWLDNGEWKLLADLNMQKHLGTIFTQPWQRRVAKDTATNAREARLKKKFGEEYEKFDELRVWLATHPHRSEVLALLQEF
jgi:Zn-finger nucleic acid-binding protein